MKKKEIAELLHHVELGRIIEFAAEYAAGDERFYKEIKKAFLPEDDEETFDIDYYREIAEDCFDCDLPYTNGHYRYYVFEEAVAGKAALGLEKLLGDATFYTEQRKYADAAAMAMAISEVIPHNAENVHDSDGELIEIFNRAIKLLCNIVNSKDAAIFVKKQIYQWSKEEVKKSEYSYYGFDEIKAIYEHCCEQLGDPAEVLSDIERQINEAKNDYHKNEAILRKIRFMQLKGMDIQDVIQTHLDLNSVRKIWFDQLKSEGAYDRALQLAAQSIEIGKQNNYNSVRDWKKAMYDIYLLQGDTTRLLPIAEYLLLNNDWQSNKDELYTVLKKNTLPTEWPDTVERILSTFEKEHNFNSFAAHIMHEQQMWSRLFAYCKKGGISQVERYEKELKLHFEEELLEYYKDFVEKKALITDQFAYEEVARILKRMRELKNGNEIVEKLLVIYRVGYKRRKNMIEALKGV